MKICVVDYGLGNIFSIRRAVQFLGYEADITRDPAEIKGSDRIILPGVGAFGDGMSGLRETGLDQVLRECVGLNKPILGICLGMQLLLSSSEEFGRHEGLNFIPGRVKKFPAPVPAGLQYKIPHVGWSPVFPVGQVSDWGVMRKNQLGDYMYFVHSFRAIPDDPAHVLARSVYGGNEFCSAVRKGNVYGVQFHPELSASAGLKIYQAFLEG